MAMSVGASDPDAPLNDMNTTPLIDVMLVLLVMFIVTLPIQTHAVKIDLPTPSETPNEPQPDPVRNKITIASDNTIFWNGQSVDMATLNRLLDQSAKMEPEPELQFQPDPTARYVIVDEVLAAVKENEISKFGFVGNSNYYSVF